MNRVPPYRLPLLVLIGDIMYIYWVLNVAGQRNPFTLLMISSLVGGVSLLVFLNFWDEFDALRKGQLMVRFADTTYEYGNLLRGKVQVQTHTVLEAWSLRIALVAKIKRPKYEGPTYNIVWYREIDLLDAGTIDIGTQEFDFSFQLPYRRTTSSDDSLLSKIAMVREEFGLPRRQRVGLAWYLRATLDVPGTNLYDERIVRVNDN